MFIHSFKTMKNTGGTWLAQVGRACTSGSLEVASSSPVLGVGLTLKK